MINVILFHDGCNICEGISAGIERLPSLVTNGQMLRLENHSAIDHCA
jgi:hypothetical protein